MQELYTLFLQSSGVCTDTRAITQNCLFIALKGANFDGNSFAMEALAQGAMACIVDDISLREQANCFWVEDCLVFLQELANHHRNQYNIPIIGITGSNGKTSTKELIAAVLARTYSVLYTKGNLNNHIGVPLTLLQLNSTHEIAIIEMGANKFKDIEELCNIAEPTHGIITNIGKAHLEGFLSFEGVLKTKLEMYHAIVKKQGTLFYNLDDALLVEHLPSGINTFSYGTQSSADVSGTLDRLTPFVELHWQTKDYQSPILSTQMVGEYNFYNFLAAISIGQFFGVPVVDIDQAIQTYVPSNNRSQVTKTEKNTLIVDCYNANPTSMHSALRSFVQIDQLAKCAILGDMRELGKEEDFEHQVVLDFLRENKVNSLLVGPVFSRLNDGTFSTFQSVDELLSHLDHSPLIKELILLKGSRGIQLEKAIAKL